MRHTLLLTAALLAGGVALAAPSEVMAQTRRAVVKTAEGSMVLTGQIDIGTEGQVEAFVLDDRESVPAELAGFVDRSVQTWRFEPIVRDGSPIRGRTFVSIRLVAKAGPDGRDLVTVQAANFERYDPQATDRVTKQSMPAPRFPSRAADMRGRGEVLLLIQVARDGSVTDVVAEQVNLHVAGDERQMKRLRDLFADESVSAARRWTFRPPSTGSAVDDPHWTVRVPVRFDDPETRAAYGKWNVYIPGPRVAAPWREKEENEGDVAGLLSAGGIYMAGNSSGPRLLTPLGG